MDKDKDRNIFYNSSDYEDAITNENDENDENDTSKYSVVAIKNDTISSKVYTPEILDTLNRHGRYIRKSLLCPVCNRADHIEINLMRAKDHLSLKEISSATGITVELLEKHFQKHYLLSSQNQKLLALKEDVSSEAKEIVARLMQGDLDMYGSIAAILKGKAQRLNEIYSIINEYNTKRDMDIISDMEIQEWVALNKLAADLEDSIVKTVQLIDRKIIKVKNIEKSAVQAYELQILSKMVDCIQLVLKEIEQEGDLERKVIQKIRHKLAQYFNAMEDKILKSSVIVSDSSDNNL